MAIIILYASIFNKSYLIMDMIREDKILTFTGYK